MSDTTTETPAWLERLSYECDTPEGEPKYTVPQELWNRITMSNHFISPWVTLASWLAWRSRLADALGFSEPRIAAELRRLADRCNRLPGHQGNSMGDFGSSPTAYDAAALLIARADELDPPKRRVR